MYNSRRIFTEGGQISDPKRACRIKQCRRVLKSDAIGSGHENLPSAKIAEDVFSFEIGSTTPAINEPADDRRAHVATAVKNWLDAAGRQGTADASPVGMVPSRRRHP